MDPIGSLRVWYSIIILTIDLSQPQRTVTNPAAATLRLFCFLTEKNLPPACCLPGLFYAPALRKSPFAFRPRIWSAGFGRIPQTILPSFEGSALKDV
jgi:hypothetical protein